KVKLIPHLWKFDNSLNRINPLSLGNFYEIDNRGEREISHEKFREYFNIRTIRGDESLKQQILFFKDVFMAKIEQKIKNLEKKSDFLNQYQEWISETLKRDIIESYIKLQEEYGKKLEKIDQFERSNLNRKSKIKKTENQIELLKKLVFICENDEESLTLQKQEEKSKIEQLKAKREEDLKKLIEYEKKYDDFKNQFDNKTQNLLKKIGKKEKERDKLEKRLISDFNLNLESLHEKESNLIIKEIGQKINKYEEELTDSKSKIEQLNKKNKRIIEINKFLTQLRDTCSKASSHDFGKENLIKFKLENENEFYFSFEKLHEIFEDNNLVFKENKKLKQYKNTVQGLNEKIKKNKEILEVLKEYRKNQTSLMNLKKQLMGKSSRIDDYINLETKINNLKEKIKEKKENIENLEREIESRKKKIEDIENLLNQINEIPSKLSLINKLGLKMNQPLPSTEILTKKISDLNQELELNKQELRKMEYEEEKIKTTIEEFKKKLNPLTLNIKEVARKFGFLEMGKFIDYYNNHIETLNKYINSTKDLQKRLKILKDDIEKVIEGKKPKNDAHLRIITEQFDKIFKDIYGKKEFFEYVFKDYSKILQFDIRNKTIIFETKAGLQETRDLEDFSSGEKTYAYCRSIISMSANIAKYNIVVLDESYALLDHEHGQNLYQFQEEMVQKGYITKFVNLLPLKEDLDTIAELVERTINDEKKRGFTSNIDNLNSQLNNLHDFKEDVANQGYYQEINFPISERKILDFNVGNISLINNNENFSESKISQEGSILGINDGLKDSLEFSFILDGSNIAYNNPISNKPSIKNVINCKKKLIKLGVPEKNILIIFGSGIRHKISEGELTLFEKLINEQNISQAPAGRDDDWFIIDFARENNSYIITNDRYLDYREKYPQYDQFLEEHSIRYNILANRFQFEEGFKEKIKKIMAGKL
ncbi:MAG: NYN domain-containing protein, partial [Promethearchaeota archaeon]